MAIALEVYFDDATDTEIRRRWAVLIVAGIPCPLLSSGARPHISLGVARAADTAALSIALDAVITTAPIELTLGSVGAFGTTEGVVFLAPVNSSHLLSWHESAWRAFSEYAEDLSLYYAPDGWIPHITMSYGLNTREMAAAIQCLLGLSLPIVVQPSAIGIVSVRATQLAEIWIKPLIRVG